MNKQDVLRHIPKDFTLLPDMVIEKNDAGVVIAAYFEKDRVYDGEYVTYFLDGSIESVCFYREGALHGPSKIFNESGILLSETEYLFGKKEGKVTRRYLSGTLSAIERFKEGEKEGKQEYFGEDGSLQTLLHFHLGKLDGKAILYYPSGLVKREEMFKEGKPL